MNTQDNMSPDDWTDRRVYARLPVVQVVQLQHPTGPQLASSKDLSLGGIGVVVEEPLPLGALVNVAFDLGTEGRLDVMSVVMRVGPTVGLRFGGLTPLEGLALQAFLAQSQSRPS